MAQIPSTTVERARSRILGDIGTGGVPAVAETLIQAYFGDETAARMPVSALLYALPGRSWLDVRTLLGSTGIGERDTAGQLRTEQYQALATALDSLPRS
jgi:hypothetical protein